MQHRQPQIGTLALNLSLHIKVPSVHLGFDITLIAQLAGLGEVSRFSLSLHHLFDLLHLARPAGGGGRAGGDGGTCIGGGGETVGQLAPLLGLAFQTDQIMWW